MRFWDGLGNSIKVGPLCCSSRRRGGHRLLVDSQVPQPTCSWGTWLQQEQLSAESSIYNKTEAGTDWLKPGVEDHGSYNL